MGHLHDPLNTFWQLFFHPPGARSWADQVEATAVATNGGLVLAPSAGPSFLVGARPSNLLTFTPIIATADGGRSWSNGLVPQDLAAHPTPSPPAPAARPRPWSAPEPRHRCSPAAQSDQLATPRHHTNPGLVARRPQCHPLSFAAVAYQAQQPVIAASCAQPGVVGLLTEGAGGWQLTGPALPALLDGDTVQVLALRSTSQGLVTLLALSGRTGTSLAAAWDNTTSPIGTGAFPQP